MAYPANTLSTKTFRDKYRSASLEKALRNMLVAEKVCQVDRSDAKTIQNPYSSSPTASVSVLNGTYDVAEFTTTDDTLTVGYEFKIAEHIYDWQSSLSQFDLFANRVDEQNYAVASLIDKNIVNNLCQAGTTTYTTPAGGFTTAANVNTIFSNIVANLSGYADAYRGMFVIVENTDLVGIVAAGATNGFNFADSVLNNGLVSNYMGVDIYVVRSGTFATATYLGVSCTTTSHRVAGVKGVATYAAPRGIQFEEKAVSGKTGMEVVTFGYIGFKLWTPKAGLVLNITLA